MARNTHCPNCGEVISVAAKFCPECRQTMVMPHSSIDRGGEQTKNLNPVAQETFKEKKSINNTGVC